MALDYDKRLENVRNRRFDRTMNESLLTKSFSDINVPKDLKYLAESMTPIPARSTKLTIEAANRVQGHLEKGLTLPLSRAYRTQGSVMSNTHIKASDFDFLTLIDRYHYTGPGVPVKNPYQGNPVDDLRQLRQQIVDIMTDTYDEVDDSHEKCISIFNKSLNRKVDIVPAYWYNTKQFEDTNNEYFRGVKFKADQQEPDYPFAHVFEVNSKGNATNDGSRMAIRLLKTFKEDSAITLDHLSSFQLTTIVHAMDNNDLFYEKGNELKIALAISLQLNRMLIDADYRKSLKGPNGIEQPFENDDSLPNIKRIKGDLDTLIADADTNLEKAMRSRRLLLTY
jgi:hypothetical protein